MHKIFFLFFLVLERNVNSTMLIDNGHTVIFPSTEYHTGFEWKIFVLISIFHKVFDLHITVFSFVRERNRLAFRSRIGY